MAVLENLYYIDFTGLDDFTEYTFDDDGLPIVNYGKGIGNKYVAITISQFGLQQLRHYHFSAEEKYLNQAIRCANWLVGNCSDWHHDTKAWVYDIQLPLYGPNPPWVSAMAQGEAVSLLLRCYSLKQDQRYLDVAKKAIKLFCYPGSENGVIDYLPDGNVVFQEYPAIPAPHVLNGFIFSLFGVWDYGCFFDDKAMLALADAGVKTLLTHWQDWDFGYWTRYDLYPIKRYASPMYHRLHIQQMRVLARVFQQSEFEQVAERWQNMYNSPVCRSRWFAGKVLEKIRLKFMDGHI